MKKSFSTILKFKNKKDAELLLSKGKKYIKKLIPIRAIQLHYIFTVKTLEGTMKGKIGDYLVEGIKGELYICDKTIFEESYVEYQQNPLEKLWDNPEDETWNDFI
jgi:hypothetical protein